MLFVVNFSLLRSVISTGPGIFFVVLSTFPIGQIQVGKIFGELFFSLLFLILEVDICLLHKLRCDLLERFCENFILVFSFLLT